MHHPASTFLVTGEGRPMREHYVWNAVRRVARRAGIELPGGGNVSPHTLRRTFAADLVNRGVRLEVVARVLGHSSTAVTEKHYAHLSDERLRSEIEAAFDGSDRSAAIAAHVGKAIDDLGAPTI